MSIEFKNQEPDSAFIVYCDEFPVARLDYSGYVILLGTYKTVSFEDLKEIYQKAEALRNEKMRTEEEEEGFLDLYDEEGYDLWLDDSDF